MRARNRWFSTVGTAAIMALTGGYAGADTLATNPLISTSGDGLIFSDPSEGVLPPGLKAVTFTRTRVPDPDNPGEFLYLDPFEVIITDFSDANGDIESRGDVTNCLMANNPEVYCDSAGGSGKRIKVQLTGADPFNMRFQTVPNGEVFDETGAPVDTSSVDYFTFGKVSNFTGARITGFTLSLLDADGNPMGELDPSDAVLFNLDATAIGLGARLPDGLFGAGGQEGDIGFFSDARAGLALTPTEDVLTFGALSNAVFVENFGTALLDDTMVPDGLFWDDNDDPDDESALVAWDNIAGGGWTYGTLDTPEAIDDRLEELADALGVDVADLEYAAGELVPDDIVAAAEANGLFAVDAVEDIRNANLNYDITIGEIDGGEFTLRWTPAFAAIVNAAQSDFQFKVAGYLDAAAEVPYWDIGNAAEYQAAIIEILGVTEAEQAMALTSIGFSIAPALSSLGFESARDQVAALTNMAPAGVGGEVGVSRVGGAQSWLMGDGMYGLFSFGGSNATYDATEGSIGYEVNSGSFTVGLERSLNANTSVGVALGAGTATAEAAADLGEIDTTGIALTAFTRSQFGNGASLQALFGYQDLSYDVTRNVMGETAEGSTDGSQIFGALTLEYLRDFGAFRFGPTGSVQYYDVTVDGFSETGAGAFNLSVEEQSSSTVLASAGVLGEYHFPGGGDSRLTGSVSYTTMSSDDLVIESGFVGLPAVSFPVQGLEEDLIDVSLGFQSVLSSNTARDIVLSGGYDGAFGEDYERHGLQLGLNVQF